MSDHIVHIGGPAKPKKAPNNPERLSTMPQGKFRHKSLLIRQKQGKVVKSKTSVTLKALTKTKMPKKKKKTFFGSAFRIINKTLSR